MSCASRNSCCGNVSRFCFIYFHRSAAGSNLANPEKPFTDPKIGSKFSGRSSELVLKWQCRRFHMSASQLCIFLTQFNHWHRHKWLAGCQSKKEPAAVISIGNWNCANETRNRIYNSRYTTIRSMTRICDKIPK